MRHSSGGWPGLQAGVLLRVRQQKGEGRDGLAEAQMSQEGVAGVLGDARLRCLMGVPEDEA